MWLCKLYVMSTWVPQESGKLNDKMYFTIKMICVSGVCIVQFQRNGSASVSSVASSEECIQLG